MQRFIKLDENNKVIAIRYGAEPVDGEIKSDIGEIGQIRLEDGTFVDPDPEDIIIPPSIGEIILTETQYQTALLEIMMLGGNEA